jgi:hypothetical protein
VVEKCVGKTLKAIGESARHALSRFASFAESNYP